MATFTDPAAFANHVAGYGKKIQAAEPKAVRAAALVAVTDIRKAASGFHITSARGGKIPLKARFDMRMSSAVIEAKPRGAWTIIEKGTKAHDIKPRKRGRRRALTVPGVGSGVYASVHHHGAHSTGKPWEIGTALAKVSAPKAYGEEIFKVFG